jgi:hypothetical protein
MALPTLPPDAYRHDHSPFGGDAPRARWQEWVSWAVVSSIASSCGLVVQTLPIDANRKDLQVETWGALEGAQRTIGLQLKSTINPNFVDHGAALAIDLARDAYDDLMAPASVPKFLVVVAVASPPDPLAVSEQQAITLNAGAWWSQVSEPSTGNANQRVRVPTAQRFDATALRTMLLKA